jgi:enoyl-CoA hydratase/carnithine racemase
MTIRTETRDGIARIEIARPERKNAITAQMYGQLADALAAAEAGGALAVVLHGAPDVFSSGNDVQDFLQQPAGGTGNARRFMDALIGMPQPVLAAVNGVAVGIGTTLLLHCDLVIAADDARFSMPFVSLGLCPEFASSLLLPLAAGYHRAAQKLLFSEPISAEEAVEMGIVNRLVPPGEVLEHTLRQAARLRDLPPGAVRETKRLLKAGWRAATEQVIGTEFEAFQRLLQSAEAREALNAFLERRKPDFARAAS